MNQISLLHSTSIIALVVLMCSEDVSVLADEDVVLPFKFGPISVESLEAGFCSTERDICCAQLSQVFMSA